MGDETEGHITPAATTATTTPGGPVPVPTPTTPVTPTVTGNVMQFPDQSNGQIFTASVTIPNSAVVQARDMSNGYIFDDYPIGGNQGISIGKCQRSGGQNAWTITAVQTCSATLWFQAKSADKTKSVIAYTLNVFVM